MKKVSLVKYHGVGNDFLIALDPAGLPGGSVLDPAFAAWLCDRRRGLGADGVIVARPATGAGDVRMELANADGSPAETSGNGLRCLGLALADAGLAPDGEVLVETDAGPRRVSLERREPAGAATLRAEMGVVRIGDPVSVPAGLGPAWRARHAEVGNPHLVLLGPSLDGVDIAALGSDLERARPGGQNVEAASPAGDGLALVVWERGAGVTEACGTGSCAVAAVARASGLVGDLVAVHNPGGTLVVDLSGPDPLAPEAGLSGPAARVAYVEVDLDDVGAAH